VKITHSNTEDCNGICDFFLSYPGAYEPAWVISLVVIPPFRAIRKNGGATKPSEAHHCYVISVDRNPTDNPDLSTC